MNILLDENLDWRLGRELTGHRVSSVPLIGWAGVKNGELLRRAEAQFVIIVALQAKTNRLAETRLLMPALLSLLQTAQPGEYHTV